MVEIDQFKLHALFASPAEFYEGMINRRGYTPKQAAEFDAELIAPGWASMGHVLLAVMVHTKKEAFVIMLDSSDLTALKETLAGQQVSLNFGELVSRNRLGFGAGL
jgi:hypothetical protein